MLFPVQRLFMNLFCEELPHNIRTSCELFFAPV